MTSLRAKLALFATAALALPLLAVAPAHADPGVSITIADINDFHGRIDANTVKVAGTVEQIRADAGGDDHSLFISAGDNVGASLFASATQNDDPTIDVLNALDLQASAVGNHEFDKGFSDLSGHLSARADFPYLAANVTNASGAVPSPLKASTVITKSGVRIALIGAVTQETPALVSPAGITGLTFGDPVAAVNAEVARLKAADAADVYVALYHEGAPSSQSSTQTLAAQESASAVFRHIVDDTTGTVSAIFTAHTHQTYVYTDPNHGGRPVIQTGSYGANVAKLVMSVDPATDAVTITDAQNVARSTAADSELIAAYPRVAVVNTITQAALDHATTVGNSKIGAITGSVTTAYSGGSYGTGGYTGGTRDDRASESTLGGLVSDAMLAQAQKTPAGGDIALNNPGGLRAELSYAADTSTNPANTDGVVTYAEANSVLPFVNNLSTVTLTGAQLKSVLEQQWQRDASGNVPSRPYLQLGSSKNFSYTYDASRDEGDRITGMRVNGSQVTSTASYKVVVPSFLAAGGDNFRAFTLGTSVDTGLVDYEAWIAYLTAKSPITPDYARRSVAVSGLKSSYPAGSLVTFSLPKLDLTSQGSPQNTNAVATLTYGGRTMSIGAKGVTNGASDQFGFSLPSGFTGNATITVVAHPSETTVTLPITVTKATPTISVTGTASAAVGDKLAIGVTVGTTSAPGTGNVTLKLGTKTLSRAALYNGSARLLVPARTLAAGQNVLTVSYGGDSVYAATTRDHQLTARSGTSSVSAVGGVAVYGKPVAIDLARTTSTPGIVAISSGGKLLTFTVTVGRNDRVYLPAKLLGKGLHTLQIAAAPLGSLTSVKQTTTVALVR